MDDGAREPSLKRPTVRLDDAARDRPSPDGAAEPTRVGSRDVLEIGGADDVHALQVRYATVGPVHEARLLGEVAALAPELRRAAFHEAVQHLLPGGVLVHPPHPALDALAAEFELQAPTADDLAEWPTCRVWRRTTRTTIHDLVHEARASIARVTAHELAVRLASAVPPLVVDTRTPTDRARFGVIAGSIHVPRTVLEWHLDPANGYRHPLAPDFDEPIVVVCNGGYSSSLAAANVARLGFTDVADLVGGVHAWRLAGLPLVPADHSHLDL